MLRKYYIHYSSLWWYVRNENIKGVTLIVDMFMYDDDYDWRANLIIELKKLIKEIDGGFEWYG